MFREKVFGRDGGVFCGARDTVQAVDDLRPEAAGHPPRQVRVLLLLSVPAPVLSHERAQVVSHFLRGVSPCKQVEMWKMTDLILKSSRSHCRNDIIPVIQR